jgi:beta-galactosidase
VKLPLPALQQESGAEYLLNVYAYTKYPSEMIPEGHEVAREQFVLNGNSYFSGQKSTTGAIDMKEENNVLFFTCGDVRISFNKRNGELNGYRYQDKMLLGHAPQRNSGARLPIMISVTAWVFFAMFGVLPDKTRSSKA